MAPLEVTTIAGSGAHDHLDGLGAAAQFFEPDGLTFDSAGDLIVCDTDNGCIRKVDANGAVTTVAGSPSDEDDDDVFHQDGVGATARFSNPRGPTADKFDNLYDQSTCLSAGGGMATVQLHDASHVLHQCSDQRQLYVLRRPAVLADCRCSYE